MTWKSFCRKESVQNRSRKTLRVLGNKYVSTIVVNLMDCPKATLGALPESRVQTKTHTQCFIGCKIGKLLNCGSELSIGTGDTKSLPEKMEELPNFLNPLIGHRVKQSQVLQAQLRLQDFGICHCCGIRSQGKTAKSVILLSGHGHRQRTSLRFDLRNPFWWIS